MHRHHLALLSGCAVLRENKTPEKPAAAATEISEEKVKSKKPPRKENRRMLVTAYDPGPKSCGWKYEHGLTVYSNGPMAGKVKKVGITADGSRVKIGTIAADLSRYPFGTRMYVPGYGWGEVHDVGSAIKGDHIDVFQHTEAEAKRWGKRRLTVTVIWPDTESYTYKRKQELNLALREDLKKKLKTLAQKKNLKERDLVAEAVEDLLRKYETEKMKEGLEK